MATKVIKANGSVENSIQHIIVMIQEAAKRPFSQSIAAKMLQSSPDVVSQLKWLFRNACRYSYKFDEDGIEQLKTPERLDRDGFGDCDDYTIFQGSVLFAAGIPFNVKVVDWNNDGWDHIYIAATANGKEYILDPVTVTSGQMQGGGFNVEKTDYKRSKNYNPMRIEQLSGLNNNSGSPFEIDLSLELPGLRGLEPIRVQNSAHARGITTFKQSRSPLTVPENRPVKTIVVGSGSGKIALPHRHIEVPNMVRARNHFGAPQVYVPRREVLGPKAMFLMLLDIERESALLSEQLCQSRLRERGIVVPLSGMEGEKPVSELLGNLYEGVAALATDADMMRANDLHGLMALCMARHKGVSQPFGTLLEGTDDRVFDSDLSGKKSPKKAAKQAKKKERRTKIKNAIKKVGKGILTAVKKVSFAPIRLAFRALIRTSPQVATAFLYTFIDDAAFLAKYPKVAAKKKKADKMLDKFVKILGFKRDVLLKTFRNAIMKRFKMTPKDYILKLARKSDPSVVLNGFGRVRGGGGDSTSAIGGSIVGAAAKAVPGVSQAMAAKDIIQKILAFFKKIFGGKKGAESDPEFGANDVPGEDDFGDGRFYNASNQRTGTPPIVDNNEFVPTDEGDEYDTYFNPEKNPLLARAEAKARGFIEPVKKVIDKAGNIVEDIDESQEAINKAGAGVSKISNTLPWIAAGISGAFIIGMVIYSNSKN